MHKARKVGGFTLIEMLVVLVLIGLLAGLVGPKLFGKVDSSKVQTAQTQVKMIKGALESMRLDIGRRLLQGMDDPRLVLGIGDGRRGRPKPSPVWTGLPP